MTENNNEDKKEDGKKKSKLTFKGNKLSLGKKLTISTPSSSNVSNGKHGSVTVVSKKRFVAKNNVEPKKELDTQVFDDSNLTQDEKINRMKVLENAAKSKAIKAAEEEKLREIEQEKKLAEDAKKIEEEKKAVKKEEKIQKINVEQNVETKEPKSDKFKQKDSKITQKHAKLDDSEELVNQKNNKSIKKTKDEIKKGSSRGSKRQLQDLKNNLTGKADDVEETITERVRSLASIRRAQQKQKKRREDLNKEYEKVVRDVILPDVITVAELSNRMAERVNSVVGELMKLGVMASSNQTIDADTAELVISAFGHKMKRVKDTEIEDILENMNNREEDESKLITRAPVVTIMGHVDHGKTSLLDAMRLSDVAAGEAGGITQHIGAYRINVGDGKEITFLDTPGHEAFTAMRLRGAQSTDIVIIVVAADDGIMAQTIEAINHAKAAEVPIIVAINKIDKPGADITRVKNELMRYELITEELGGDVMCVEVSAKNKTNLNGLIEAILLQSEVMELSVNPNREAIGVVVEAKIDKNFGPISTMLVQKGTLNIGNIVIVGSVYGKVRALRDDKGRKVINATPSTPVEVIGINGAPEAGDKFYVVSTEKEAREICEFREHRTKELKDAKMRKNSSFEELLKDSKSNCKELSVVIKADVQGSLEAIKSSLEKISTDEVRVKFIHSAVGAINESDVSLAMASGAMMVGFNVRAGVLAKKMMDSEGINIRYYSIIYNLMDDIKSMLSGMLSPTIREEFIGNVEIREVFNITKVGKVAGSYVTSGIVKRASGVRLLRDNVVIHEGKLKTLKRFKDDVKEVKSGFECGIAFERYDDIKAGDIVEVFEVIEEKRELL